MKEPEALQILGGVGAVLKGHFVGASWKHLSAYINKDALYPHTMKTSLLCRAIAELFANDGVEVVVAPAVGGVILSQWTAHHLSEITGREVLGTYAEKAERSIFKCDGLPHGVNIGYQSSGDVASFTLEVGEELFVRDGSFVIKRGYDKLVRGRKVLMVEDLLTTGVSVRKVIEATRAFDADIIGLGVLCNRGNVTSADVGSVPKLAALVNVKLDAWAAEDCPLCAQGVSINTDVGHGAAFLALQKK